MPRETKRPQSKQETEDLPLLTPKQHKWLKGYLEGMTLSNAYKDAYDCENMSDEAIWVEASRMGSNPKIALWIRATTEHNLASCAVTLDSHRAELDRLSRLAEQAGAYGAAIKAQELRGRVSALYVDQIKTDDGKVDVLEALRAIAQQDTQLAQRLGGLLNVSESDILGDDKSLTGGKNTTTH